MFLRRMLECKNKNVLLTSLASGIFFISMPIIAINNYNHFIINSEWNGFSE